MQRANVEFIVTACDAGHLVTAAGEVDMGNAAQLAECLAQFANGDVIFDMAGIEFIDSSGLNALLAAHRHIARRGGQLLIRDAPARTMQVFNLTGLVEVFHFDGHRDYRVVVNDTPTRPQPRPTPAPPPKPDRTRVALDA